MPRFGNCIPSYDASFLIVFQINSVQISFFARTPFEMNTTLRCASMVIFEAFGSACASFVFSTLPSLLSAFMLYSEAFILDIKSIYAQLDCLSKRRNSPRTDCMPKTSINRENLNLVMLQRCREMVELHRKLIRYRGQIQTIIRLSFTFFFSFQTHAWLVRFNEIYDFCDDRALGILHMHCTVSDCRGTTKNI